MPVPEAVNGSTNPSILPFTWTCRLTDPALAYWIAFGPHGPRSLPPPGEGKMIFKYVSIAVGISFILFAFTRSMARPAPKTMNAQYQEMTNEYLRVRQKIPPLVPLPYLFGPITRNGILLNYADIHHLHRTKTQNQSPASPQKATKEREWCKADHGKEAFPATTRSRSGAKGRYLLTRACTLPSTHSSRTLLNYRYWEGGSRAR